MRFTSWGSAGIWLAAGAVAVGLTLLAPSERAVMGQLPPLAAKARDQRQLTLPQELPAERTLALLIFRHEQKAEARTWIDGLLAQDASIPWLKVRVLPPDEVTRQATARPLVLPTAPLPPGTLLPGARPERLLSVAANAGQLAQAMALPDTEHAQVVVLSRDGQVLAKAQGAYDEQKARALLETLRASSPLEPFRVD
ncbi:hypothetical protein [Ramlibacter agri]|uniref:hypothetical protein n=1 Tax=Ramlibacter agri TaxID=2728837 RepID=UPI00146D1A5B|nr:hypothetical protein [Ramlibacter agri]